MKEDKQKLITKREQMYINCLTRAVSARYHFTLALVKLKGLHEKADTKKAAT